MVRELTTKHLFSVRAHNRRQLRDLQKIAAFGSSYMGRGLYLNNLRWNARARAFVGKISVVLISHQRLC